MATVIVKHRTYKRCRAYVVKRVGTFSAEVYVLQTPFPPIMHKPHLHTILSLLFLTKAIDAYMLSTCGSLCRALHLKVLHSDVTLKKLRCYNYHHLK